MEIERKYLVTSDSYKQMAVARYHICQGYISREKTGTVRIRITDNKAYLTIKGKPAAGHFARYEWEKEIAVAEAEEMGIHGKATTPFLLAKVKELTGGDSLDSNIQLVYNNARLAAKTAVALSK